MTDYTKNKNFTASRGADSDPAVFDTEFDELETVSATKADKAGGVFTGAIEVPAGATGSQVARKSEIDSDLTAALALKANLASPNLTGSPTTTTAGPGTDTTRIATTAFVKAAIAAAIPARATSSHSVTEGSTAHTNSTSSDLVLMLTFAMSHPTNYGIGTCYIGGSIVSFVKGEFVHTPNLALTIVVPAGSTYGFTTNAYAGIQASHVTKNV